MEKLKFNEAVKRILDRMVGDLIRNLQSQIKAAGIRSLEDVRACPRRLATFSPEVEEERRGTKEFLYQNLYFSAALDPEKNDAERVIRQLFDFWMAKPESLPQSYQEKAGQEPLPRVICDYIAGMTDNFIYEQHEKYCGTNNRVSPDASSGRASELAEVFGATSKASRALPDRAGEGTCLYVLRWAPRHAIHHSRGIVADIHRPVRPDHQSHRPPHPTCPSWFHPDESIR